MTLPRFYTHTSGKTTYIIDRTHNHKVIATYGGRGGHTPPTKPYDQAQAHTLKLNHEWNQTQTQ